MPLCGETQVRKTAHLLSSKVFLLLWHYSFEFNQFPFCIKRSIPLHNAMLQRRFQSYARRLQAYFKHLCSPLWLNYWQQQHWAVRGGVASLRGPSASPRTFTLNQSCSLSDKAALTMWGKRRACDELPCSLIPYLFCQHLALAAKSTKSSTRELHNPLQEIDLKLKVLVARSSDLLYNGSLAFPR